MGRLAATAFVVALLAAAGGAFALTVGSTVEASPIADARADTLFSPACGCGTGSATIDFRLRTRDRLSAWVERDGKRARVLAPGRTYEPGRVRLVFDGITEAGLTLPDGIYRPVVHLEDGHRTIELPTPIRLDTKPPAVRAPHRVYTHISPDGDGRRDTFRVRYRLSEPGRGILLVDGRQVVRAPTPARAGTVVWNGRVGGRLARPGNHVLKISAEDAAGNRARPFPFAVVSVRFVSFGRTRVLAKPGTHFAILVAADAPRFTWRFARGRGEATPGTLRLRAPRKPGVYRLYATASGHAAKALVVVG